MLVLESFPDCLIICCLLLWWMQGLSMCTFCHSEESEINNNAIRKNVKSKYSTKRRIPSRRSESCLQDLERYARLNKSDEVSQIFDSRLIWWDNFSAFTCICHFCKTRLRWACLYAFTPAGMCHSICGNPPPSAPVRSWFFVINRK